RELEPFPDASAILFGRPECPPSRRGRRSTFRQPNRAIRSTRLGDLHHLSRWGGGLGSGQSISEREDFHMRKIILIAAIALTSAAAQAGETRTLSTAATMSDAPATIQTRPL